MAARLPWLILGIFTALWAARWPLFPPALDPCYHLLIARQVAEAGGPIAYEPWEYAPLGRPHLYPPVLHALLAALLTLGCEPLTALRMFSALLLPGLMVSLFAVARRLFGPFAALACLWAALAPFPFHLHSAVAMASTLGLIELLWLLAAVERGRIIAAGLLLALLGYTHLGLPWVAALTLAGYALLRPEKRREALGALWGLGLLLPWWGHLWHNRVALQPFPRYENTLVELLPALWLAALAGAVVCWRRRSRWTWPLACWGGFLPLAPVHTYRWLNGEGLLPVILLAGVGLDAVAERLAGIGRAGSRGPGHARRVLLDLALFLVLAVSPSAVLRAGAWRWTAADSGPFHLFGLRTGPPKDLELGLYSPPMAAVIRAVSEHSRPGEILWSNAPYAIGLVAALTGRPISTAMLNEVRPLALFDAVQAAHVVVWFKIGPMPGWASPAELKRYPLSPVADGAVATVFRQSGPREPAQLPHAVLPLWAALAALAVVVGIVVRALAG